MVFTARSVVTALNVGIQLNDEFEKLGVKNLGTPIETILKTEDPHGRVRGAGQRHRRDRPPTALQAQGGAGCVSI